MRKDAMGKAGEWMADAPEKLAKATIERGGPNPTKHTVSGEIPGR